MADEVKEEKVRTPGRKKKIIVLASVIILPIIAAVVVYFFVIGPMLSGPSGVENEDEGEQEAKISVSVVTVSFDSQMATVLKSNPELPASQLMFIVALECNNQVTADLVLKHKPRFTHEINNLHEFRTREELDDRLVKETIEKQILQKANSILKQLQAEPDKEIKVVAVFHEQWVIHDSM